MKENSGAYITCRDLGFAYEGNMVVWGLNFAVEPADYLCVIGENGSGKTTLLRGLLGLKAPQEGTLQFGGGLSPGDTGYLPQNTAVQKDFPAGVQEVVLSGRLGMRGFRPFYSRADKRAAEENMERLGVADLRERCYRELSGGQRQRVLLARALCASRKLLILDEPAAGLDPLVTADLYRLLEEINRDPGIAIVMVSHDVPGAAKHAKRILHLRGEPLFFGTSAEYVQSGTGRRFLGGGDD
ncbi:MAG: ATP-binding cassette domain-containing protein [Spirochaetaceae bacterium]|jgi:zinc transport system ATP-binding protein|nr:ATP-binding cassette domain-containing protein [Spirochaetaceae bacterium]